MKNLLSILFTYVIFSTTLSAADLQPKPSIVGSVDAGFIVSALGTMPEGFSIPAVLFFDGKGCLAWSNFGLAENWESTMPKSWEVTPSCAEPKLPNVLRELRERNLAVDDTKSDTPILIWYGSDSMCPDCKNKSSDLLPALIGRLPADTQLFKLDWK